MHAATQQWQAALYKISYFPRGLERTLVVQKFENVSCASCFNFSSIFVVFSLV